MAQRLTANVVLRHPDTGAATCLRAGTEPPAWAVPRLGGHVLSGKPDAPEPVAVDVTVHGGSGGDLEGTAEVTPAGPPPRSGKGSSDEAWTKYARSRDVAVTDEMKRSEVIAACEAAGVPTTD